MTGLLLEYDRTSSRARRSFAHVRCLALAKMFCRTREGTVLIPLRYPRRSSVVPEKELYSYHYTTREEALSYPRRSLVVPETKLCRTRQEALPPDYATIFMPRFAGHEHRGRCIAWIASRLESLHFGRSCPSMRMPRYANVQVCACPSMRK